MFHMKRLFVVPVFCLLAYGVVSDARGFHRQSSAPPSAAPRVPVIVELFTSEGCSSCPPADALLARLESAQPVSGAQIIALEEHVDYWDHLGWMDPFSSAEWTRRQQDYSGAFRRDGEYTPQMVVDGREEFVGSRSDLAARALEDVRRIASTVVEVGAGQF